MAWALVVKHVSLLLSSCVLTHVRIQDLQGGWERGKHEHDPGVMPDAITHICCLSQAVTCLYP